MSPEVSRSWASYWSPVVWTSQPEDHFGERESLKIEASNIMEYIGPQHLGPKYQKPQQRLKLPTTSWQHPATQGLQKVAKRGVLKTASPTWCFFLGSQIAPVLAAWIPHDRKSPETLAPLARPSVLGFFFERLSESSVFYINSIKL